MLRLGVAQCQGEVTTNEQLSGRKHLAGMGQQQESWGLASSGLKRCTPHPPPVSSRRPSQPGHFSSPDTRWRSPPCPVQLLAPAGKDGWMGPGGGPTQREPERPAPPLSALPGHTSPTEELHPPLGCLSPVWYPQLMVQFGHDRVQGGAINH